MIGQIINLVVFIVAMIVLKKMGLGAMAWVIIFMPLLVIGLIAFLIWQGSPSVKKTATEVAAAANLKQIEASAKAAKAAVEADAAARVESEDTVTEEQKWLCDSTAGSCTQDATGTYATESDCNSNCQAPLKWFCDSTTGTCTQDSADTYTTEADCNTNCQAVSEKYTNYDPMTHSELNYNDFK